jgi:hypothetical protein
MLEEAATLPEQWPMWGIPVMPVAEGIIIWHKKPTIFFLFIILAWYPEGITWVLNGYHLGTYRVSQYNGLKVTQALWKVKTLGLFYLT